MQTELVEEDSAPGTQQNSADLIPQTTMQELLDEYKDVFEELKGLPPYREVGHTIPLVDGP